MADVKVRDRQSSIKAGDIVGFSSEKSIVRWLEDGFCVIENASNRYCIIIDVVGGDE